MNKFITLFFVGSTLISGNQYTNNCTNISNAPPIVKTIYSDSSIRVINYKSKSQGVKSNLKEVFGKMKDLSDFEKNIYRRGLEKKVKYSSVNIFND